MSAPLCRDCGLFPRLPAMMVCSACWEVEQEKSNRELHARLADPDHPTRTCVQCGEQETPDELVAVLVAQGQAIVSMCAVVKDQRGSTYGWACSGCIFGDDDGEEWKRA